MSNYSTVLPHLAGDEGHLRSALRSLTGRVQSLLRLPDRDEMADGQLAASRCVLDICYLIKNYTRKESKQHMVCDTMIGTGRVVNSSRYHLHLHRTYNLTMRLEKSSFGKSRRSSKRESRENVNSSKFINKSFKTSSNRRNYAVNNKQ